MGIRIKENKTETLLSWWWKSGLFNQAVYIVEWSLLSVSIYLRLY